MPTKVTIPECQQNILEKNGKLVISRAIFNDEITVAASQNTTSFTLKTLGETNEVNGNNFEGCSYNLLQTNVSENTLKLTLGDSESSNICITGNLNLDDNNTILGYLYVGTRDGDKKKISNYSVDEFVSVWE